MTIESHNPVNDDTLTGAFKEVLRKFLQKTDDMLPAVVQSYDRNSNLAIVKPFIQMVDTTGIRHDRASVRVPVLLIGGGEFFISFHLPVGSFGWLKANDRDISLFLQSHNAESPNTARMHSFEDGLFIPDLMTNYSIDDEDQQAMVIQDRASSVKISLNQERITIKAPRLLISASDEVAIDASSIIINGNISTSGQLINNGINVSSTHTHTQPPDSAGNYEQNTGPPS